MRRGSLSERYVKWSEPGCPCASDRAHARGPTSASLEESEGGPNLAVLVSHSGNSASGEFAHTLNVIDIHTTWTESRAVLGRSKEAIQRALHAIAMTVPFPLRGVDSDNGCEFVNWHLQGWCEQKHIQLTRGRPYKRDDNAHIEHKNWTHVRKLLAWDRHDTHEAVAAMNDLYGGWLNLYLPSVKLVKKVRPARRCGASMTRRARRSRG